MNYESEALIFYHDEPEENIKYLSYFLKTKLSNNCLCSKSKKKLYNYQKLLVLSDNLLSFFICNDNKKISYLLNRLLAIYSRAIKRIKLKYFLRYYQKAILAKYLRYKKMSNAFKRKATSSKSISNFKTKINFDSFNKPQYSYSLNKSEPYIFKNNINKNIAYLVTPCYILDDDDEITSKKIINKFSKSVNGAYPKKKDVFFRTNSEIFTTNEPFYKTYFNTNKNKKIFNDSKKDIYFTLEEEKNKNKFNDKGLFIDNINDNIQRQFSKKQFPFNFNFRKKNNNEILYYFLFNHYFYIYSSNYFCF